MIGTNTVTTRGRSIDEVSMSGMLFTPDEEKTLPMDRFKFNVEVEASSRASRPAAAGPLLRQRGRFALAVKFDSLDDEGQAENFVR
jgi:hypothetical protein